MHRVVITGAGVICPIGASMVEMDAALRAGRSGIKDVATLNLVDNDRVNQKIIAPVTGFVPEDHFDAREIGMMETVSQYAVFAAREAIGRAGLDFNEELADETAVIVGTGIGGQSTQEEGYRRVYLENKRPHPFTVPRMMPNAPASQISMAFGLKGPSYAISSACASATHAVGNAFQMVRSGVVRAAVTGGVEACLQAGALRAWEALRVMASDACRPFSLGRKGMVLGDGAGIFVLERYEDAAARGAHILCEIAGNGMSADAGDLTAPEVEGMSKAIRRAIADAGLNPEDIDHINAHGTGTLANDRTEAAAILDVLGDRGRKVPVSATKSMHGHALGGAGAIELAALINAMNGNYVPPTINFVEPDPDCPIDCVPNEARDCRIDAALSNSFAFGGLNGVLALRRV
ncbi:MAG: beta-ketoacyl-[acyl-carrier-protein] synthase family protein [Rhodobiaceae bacterium]|nr:beta-ketoacyl-[acyl-carrier-protein] synthase family protein [Rhodobiaceae bacterium]MCC0056312.1 beta-ketoacyl-[acyl-carrier-protein] synthase family protein [Rhodobiaceae bacterium]